MEEINVEYYTNLDRNNPVRTKERLTQIKDMGLTEGFSASFRLEGVMSGLYVEKVWNYSDKEWDDYINWVRVMKIKKK